MREAALGVGVDLAAEKRAGTFLQVDSRSSPAASASALPAASRSCDLEALETPWVAERLWSSSRRTPTSTPRPPRWRHRRLLPAGAPRERLEEPLQACLLIAETALSQNLHNVVVVEEGAAAHVITGCSVHRASGGLHIGVSEFFVARGASLTFTMIHRWAPGLHAAAHGGRGRRRWHLRLELPAPREVASLQMYPVTRLRGRDARARFQAVLCAGGLGDRRRRPRRPRGRGQRLRDHHAHARRGPLADLGRGQLVALTNRCRARLECRGMLVSPEASIVAIPSWRPTACRRPSSRTRPRSRRSPRRRSPT